MVSASQLSVGHSVYNTEDGKTYVLQGSTDPHRHSWRVKLNKATQQTFFVNAADPTRKLWELPDVVGAEAAAAAGLAPPPVPAALSVRSAHKPEATGEYLLAAEEYEGMPLWLDAARGPGVVYGTATGHWMIGTRESMQAQAGWLMSCLPHAGQLPPDVARWAAFSAGEWTADPGAVVVAGAGAGSERRVAAASSPYSSPTRIRSGRTEYFLENDYWVPAGKTLEDKGHIWKLKQERDGARSFINPWTRTRVAVLPDVAADDDAAAAAVAQHGLAGMGAAPGFASAAVSAEPATPIAARSPARVTAKEQRLEAELEQQRETIRILEEKENAYKQREHSMMQHRGAVTYSDLDTLEGKLRDEKAKLVRTTQAAVVGSAAAAAAAPKEDGAVLGVLSDMQRSLQERERELHVRTAALEKGAIQHVAGTTAALDARLQQQFAQRAEEAGQSGALVQAYAQSLERKQRDYDAQAHGALLEHQRQLKERALALEHDHEEETRKLQATARQLEKLTKEREKTGESLKEAAQQQARLQQEETRLDDAAEARHPTASSLAEHEILLEKRRLQEEVNDFYMQTSQALTKARRGVEERELCTAAAGDHAQDRLGAHTPTSMFSMPATVESREATGGRAAPAAAVGATTTAVAAHDQRRQSMQSCLSAEEATFKRRAPDAWRQSMASAGAYDAVGLEKEVQHLREELAVERARQSSAGGSGVGVGGGDAGGGRGGGGGALAEFSALKEQTMRDLDAHKQKLQEEFDRREAARQTEVAELQTTLQDAMGRQLQDLKAELLGGMREQVSRRRSASREAADVSAVEELQRALQMKDELVEQLERRNADLLVSHEAEKAAVMKLANNDVLAVRSQMDRLRDGAAAAAAKGDEAERSRDEAERMQRKNDELRKEILRLRVRLSEQQDQHNAHLEEAAEASRREGARLRDELGGVRDAVRREHRAELDAAREGREAEAASLLADHRRDAAAAAELLRSEREGGAAALAALREELEGTRRRHEAAAAAAEAAARKETAELRAELERERQAARSLAEQHEAQKKQHRSLKAVHSVERARSGVAAATAAAEGTAAAAAAAVGATAVIPGMQISSMLEDELRRLQTDVVEPSANLQSRLKRFRERSMSRSHSSDPAPGYYQQQQQQPPSYARRSVSPSPSPYVHRQFSPSRPEQDDIGRLRALKEQMKHRLHSEQSNAV